MGRTLKVQKPTAQEMHSLEMRLEDDLLPTVQRRARAILYHGLGLSGRAIAQRCKSISTPSMRTCARSLAKGLPACVPCPSVAHRNA
jgi:hypothetical protein